MPQTEILTDFETRTLSMIGVDWTRLLDLTSDSRAAVDYLVLYGLVERRLSGTETWLDEWRLTAAGVDVAVPETARGPAPAESPVRLTVGSLVLHVATGGVGLIVEHTMYDANSGGFQVNFVKPVDNIVGGRVTNQLSSIFDRHDAFEGLTFS